MTALNDSSIQDWCAAKELAGQPGMPGTVQGVANRAKRESWSSRTRAGRGGGREYAFSSLPLETQAALLRKALPKPTASPSQPAAAQKSAPACIDREGLWAAYERSTQKKKDVAAHRLKALLAVCLLYTSPSPRDS